MPTYSNVDGKLEVSENKKEVATKKQLREQFQMAKGRKDSNKAVKTAAIETFDILIAAAQADMDLYTELIAQADALGVNEE